MFLRSQMLLDKQHGSRGDHSKGEEHFTKLFLLSFSTEEFVSEDVGCLFLFFFLIPQRNWNSNHWTNGVLPKHYWALNIYNINADL